MRIFLAVFPPAAVQEAAFAVVERLRRVDDGVSWVKRENLHYTMRFMGELGDKGLARVSEAARRGASEHAPFAARLGGAGAFPSPRRARVLWLGLAEGADALVALGRSVERALRGQGFDPADRAFTPHLTIGRVRRGDEDWSGRLAALAAEPAPAAAPDPTAAPGLSAAPAPAGGPAFTVDRVLVVQSTLSRRGSIYQVCAEAALGGRA